MYINLMLNKNNLAFYVSLKANFTSYLKTLFSRFTNNVAKTWGVINKTMKE